MWIDTQGEKESMEEYEQDKCICVSLKLFKRTRVVDVAVASRVSVIEVIAILCPVNEPCPSTFIFLTLYYGYIYIYTSYYIEYIEIETRPKCDMAA